MSQAVDSSASALAGSRELLAAVLAHLGDGIVVHAPNGDRLYANDAAARLIGFASAEELLAATPEVALARFDVFHADGTPMQREELPGHRALAGEEPAPTLVRYRLGRRRARPCLAGLGGPGPRRAGRAALRDHPFPRRDRRARLRGRGGRRARERLALPRGEAHVGAARLALRQRADRPRLLGPRPALRARQQRARRDQRAPVRGSPGTDVRRGRPAPRAGARVDRPAACSRRASP